eukprot:2449600-Prymnesium_polylepis.1
MVLKRFGTSLLDRRMSLALIMTTKLASALAFMPLTASRMLPTWSRPVCFLSAGDLSRSAVGCLSSPATVVSTSSQ